MTARSQGDRNTRGWYGLRTAPAAAVADTISRVTTDLAATWRDVDPDELAPVVLVAPGFLTMPGWYEAMAASLRERGAADVLVAPVYLPDWVLAAVRGLGPITTRVARALLAAGERSGASQASRGAPVLLVGHSAGGLIGRLLTSPDPFEGRTLNAAGRIGALVTLGTPNAAPPVGRDRARWARRVGEAGARFAEHHVPGAAFAPTTGYVSVASELVVGRRAPTAGYRAKGAGETTVGRQTSPSATHSSGGSTRISTRSPISRRSRATG